MQMKVSDLKEIIERCDDNSKVYVHIRMYENYEQYYVSRISSNPIHLNLEVIRNHKSTIEISQLKNAIKRYDDDTSLGFMIFDPRFEIQQAGDFDTAELDRDGNLDLYASIQPKPVL